MAISRRRGAFDFTALDSAALQKKQASAARIDLKLCRTRDRHGCNERCDIFCQERCDAGGHGPGTNGSDAWLSLRHAFAIPRRGSVMFNCCDKLREANRHVVESRERVEKEGARAAALARSGEPIEAVTVRLEEAKFTLRVMERHRDLLLWDHARGS
jgi:hypothetical protein